MGLDRIRITVVDHSFAKLSVINGVVEPGTTMLDETFWPKSI